jgi:hypothetical protein
MSAVVVPPTAAGLPSELRKPLTARIRRRSTEKYSPQSRPSEDSDTPGTSRLHSTSERLAVTPGHASGTGHRPWPVGALRTSAAVVLLVLLSFAALAWLFMLRTSGDSMTSSQDPGMGLTDNMDMAEAGPAASMTISLFLGMWVTMMVAMMFPSVPPMVVIYSRFSAIRNQSKGATAVFVGGYLLAWTLVGLLAFGVYWGSSALMGNPVAA